MEEAVVDTRWVTSDPAPLDRRSWREAVRAAQDRQVQGDLIDAVTLRASRRGHGSDGENR